MTYAREWRTRIGALVLTGVLAVFGAMPTLAQDASPAAGAVDLGGSPVALHDGSCAEPTIEPEFEIGSLESEPYADFVDDFVREEVYEDYPEYADIGDEPDLLDEDLDDDLELDDEEDLDDDDVVDFGFDENDDGVLDEDELVEADAAIFLVEFPTVWNAADDVDATFEELFGTGEEATSDEEEDDDALDDPGIVAVHESSENYGNLVACAELGDVNWEDEDDVVLTFRPVNDSGVYGYAVFERDTGNVPVIGENATRVSVYLFEQMPTPRMEPIAEGTPTP